MAQNLRYYILREPGNVMVPLVPVDQLPIQLQGIPRQLSHRQMSEGGWKFVDETAEPVVVLPIRPAQQTLPFHSGLPPTPPRFLAPDHGVRSDRAVTEISAHTRALPPIKPASAPQLSATDLAHDRHRSMSNAVQQRPLSLTDNMASVYPQEALHAGYTRLPPSGIEPDSSRKIFCSHWIKSGECAFTAVGCRFKHEMPPVDQLRKLGFLGVPRWYKEKSAIESRGLTWMQRRMNVNKDDEEEDMGALAPRVFDPSTFLGSKPEVAPGGSNVRKVEHRENVPRQENPRARVLLPKKEPQSPIPDLLIDFETAYMPPATSGTDYSIDTSNSSSPRSPVMAVPPPKSNTQPKQGEQKKEKEQPYIRRLSQMSWSSDDVAVKASKQALKRRNNQKKDAKQTSAPVPASKPGKKPGLAMSKHAPADKESDAARKQQAVGGKKVPEEEVPRQYPQVELEMEKAGRLDDSLNESASGTLVDVLN